MDLALLWFTAVYMLSASNVVTYPVTLTFTFLFFCSYSIHLYKKRIFAHFTIFCPFPILNSKKPHGVGAVG